MLNCLSKNLSQKLSPRMAKPRDQIAAEERSTMRSAPTVTETRMWERGLRRFLGSVHGQEKQKGLTDEDGSSRNPEEPILVGFTNTTEEFCPTIKLKAVRIDHGRNDQAQEDQDVEEGNDDAPFAHGSLLALAEYFSQKREEEGERDRGRERREGGLEVRPYERKGQARNGCATGRSGRGRSGAAPLQIERIARG
jgi:hypothetical protein